MKRLPILLVLCGGLSLAGMAAEPSPTFLSSDGIDVKAVLPPPPAPGSLAALGDLETVRQVQAARTPADVAWAELIEHDDVFNHATVLGPWFKAGNLPVTADFLQHVTADMLALAYRAKNVYPRPRPPLADPMLQPCVRLASSGSYPSRHAMQAFVWAMVLGDIFPGQQTALMARAHRAAWGRVIGGVHYPTDLVGGRLLAEAMMAELRRNPVYRAGVERCRQEAAPFLLKQAA